jgi:hypothetical protein
MWLALLGVGASAALWLGGARVLLSAQAAAIERLPSTWRQTAPSQYHDLASARVRDVTGESRRMVAMLVGATAMFGGLTVFDVSIGVQLGFGVVLAVLWTVTTVRDMRREQEEYRSAQRLERVERDRLLAALYIGALFAASLGFLILGLCVAQVISELAT